MFDQDFCYINDMNPKVRLAVIYLSLLGILLSSYLLYNFIVQPAFPLCTINERVNCDAVISGSVSTTLGIPTALYGLIGYAVILFAAVKGFSKLALGMAIFGTLFCLRITFIEVLLLNVICPICLLCQLVMIVILVLTVPAFWAALCKSTRKL